MASRKSNPWAVEEVQTFLTLLADDTVQRQLDGSTRNERVFGGLAAQMHLHGFARSSVQCREKLKKLKSDYRAMKDHNGRTGKQRKAWRWFDMLDGIYGHRPAANGREGGLDASMILNGIVHGGPVLGECNTSGDDEPWSAGPLSPTGSMEAPSPASSPSPTPTPGPAVPPSPTPAPAPAPAPSPRVDSTRTRKRGQETTASILREMMQADEETHRLDREQRELDREQQELDREQRERHFRLLHQDATMGREQEATLRREEMAATKAFNEGFLGTLGQLVQAFSAHSNPTHPPLE